MNLSANAKSLSQLTRDLIVKWHQTRESWKDTKAEEFEQKFLAELQGAVDRVLPVIEELDKLLRKVERDCE